MLMQNNPPYPECKTCKTLGDCPAPDVQHDMMGSPMPSELCLRPMDVMKETLKTRKHGRQENNYSVTY